MLTQEETNLALAREGIVHMAGRPAEGVELALQPGVIYNPLAPPTVSGTTFTVDFALNNPTRVITPMLIDLTLQKFFVDRVFASGGGVTGGAVIYNELEANDLYASRDVQRIAPGAEFPIITFQRRVPKVAAVEKWGGKFPFTWEARDRNDSVQFANAVRQLANTIVRKINQRGVAILDAFITANSRTIAGVSWGAVVTGGSSQTNHTGWPARDLGKLLQTAETDEMGQRFNLIIMNPVDYFVLFSIYGDKLDALLASFDISIFVTNRVAAGAFYAVAENQVGEMRLEQPLQTRSWDDADGIEQTWIQSSVRPVMFANNAFAVLKVTGIT